MTISIQTTILKSVLDAAPSIKKTNGFQSTVKKVLRGVRGLDDFAGDLPGLAIFKPLNENTRNAYNATESTMEVNIMGFTKVEARANDYSALDMLAADVEKFLMDLTYNAYVTETFINKTYFYEGGVQDSFGFFNMEIKISFVHDLDDV